MTFKSNSEPIPLLNDSYASLASQSNKFIEMKSNRAHKWPTKKSPGSAANDKRGRTTVVVDVVGGLWRGRNITNASGQSHTFDGLCVQNTAHISYSFSLRKLIHSVTVTAGRHLAPLYYTPLPSIDTHPSIMATRNRNRFPLPFPYRRQVRRCSCFGRNWNSLRWQSVLWPAPRPGNFFIYNFNTFSSCRSRFIMVLRLQRPATIPNQSMRGGGTFWKRVRRASINIYYAFFFLDYNMLVSALSSSSSCCICNSELFLSLQWFNLPNSRDVRNLLKSIIKTRRHGFLSHSLYWNWVWPDERPTCSFAQHQQKMITRPQLFYPNRFPSNRERQTHHRYSIPIWLIIINSSSVLESIFYFPESPSSSSFAEQILAFSSWLCAICHSIFSLSFSDYCNCQLLISWIGGFRTR